MNKNIPTLNEEFLPQILTYEGLGMYISSPKYEITFFSAGVHRHRGYEFMLPLIDMPLLKIDGANIYGYKNHIVPINPGQDHGVSGKMERVKFINLSYDEDLMNNIIYNAFHEQPARFDNANYPVHPELFTMIKLFMKESTTDTPEKYAMLENLSRTIAILIYRVTRKNPTNFEWGKPFNTDTIKIEKVVDYIRDNYKNDCNLEVLSELVGVSRFHLIRIFKEYMGKTPYDYLLEIKLEKAKLMLATGDVSITDICHECGFNNMSHFIRMFKKKTGTTPSIYRSYAKLEQ
ncbi:MAG TPA: helix-turn-helix transcriptional regulator [Clostridiaceae bacterium]|nr:helix-turn-helix transcriptional regulator [Clostridiaceae bacterium]